jgi:hypothetical protein
MHTKIFLQTSMKRKCVGIWRCNKCRKTIAGGAWVPRYVCMSVVTVWVYCDLQTLTNLRSQWNLVFIFFQTEDPILSAIQHTA